MRSNHWRLLLQSFCLIILGMICIWIGCQLRRQQFSNIDHGPTLAEVMDGIREEDFEVTAAFTSDGRKLFEYTNYQFGNVRTTTAHARLLAQHSDLVFVHNHPVWGEAAFSADDLRRLALCDADVGLVVSKSRIYVIAPNQAWPDPDALHAFVIDHSKFMQESWVTLPNGEICEYHGVTRQLMELIAEEYDLQYYEWTTDQVSSQEVADALFCQ